MYMGLENSRGWAALVSPVISEDQDVCHLAFKYSITGKEWISLFIYLKVEGDHTKPELLWDGKDTIDVEQSWTEQVVYLPANRWRYKIAFVAHYFGNSYRDYLILDDVQFQSCNKRE